MNLSCLYSPEPGYQHYVLHLFPTHSKIAAVTGATLTTSLGNGVEEHSGLIQSSIYDTYDLLTATLPGTQESNISDSVKAQILSENGATEDENAGEDDLDCQQLVYEYSPGIYQYYPIISNSHGLLPGQSSGAIQLLPFSSSASLSALPTKREFVIIPYEIGKLLYQYYDIHSDWLDVLHYRR
jgi:hypothetical protein